MLDKTKVSRMVKTHILSFIFAQKEKGAQKNKINFCFIKQMPKMSGFRISPPPPYIKLLKPITPLNT